MILSYDIGSTACKTCIYSLGDALELFDSELAGYGLRQVPNGGVEQDPDEWWEAMANTTQTLMARHPKAVNEIQGISFCAQMQCLVLVDKDLRPLRPAMSYLDQRSQAQRDAVLGHGIKIEGMNLGKLLVSLAINGAVAASAKDPVWKYLWVRDNEPKAFERVHKWLDAKDYLIARACGRCSMTGDSAFATFLTGEGRGGLGWSRRLARLYGVSLSHLPDIIGACEMAGHLGPEAAAQLGLPVGLPVFGGGGDASMIAVGAGATQEGDCHVYTGTSGWVALAVRERRIDVSAHAASIVSAQRGMYNFFAEQETAGKCLEWVRDHLARDEIDLYLNRHSVVDQPESRYRSMYDFLIESIAQVEPGSGGLIFAPWLHGNRSPFEDPAARGIFFNIGLDTGKRALIRAVVEGVILHQRWLLESIEKSFCVRGALRFAGGGALSPAMAQIMADIMGREVITVSQPQNCGAAGAAICAAIGLGQIADFEAAKGLVALSGHYWPNASYRSVYDRNYKALKWLYRQNKPIFAALNSEQGRK